MLEQVTISEKECLALSGLNSTTSDVFPIKNILYIAQIPCSPKLSTKKVHLIFNIKTVIIG